LQPHDFWQELLAPGTHGPADAHRGSYPAVLPDGRQLLLPIRPLADGRHALASLIINQASFAVLDALATDLARQLTPYAPEIIIGLPTLGLTLAAGVAARLGHARYVPLGFSRKFWYEESLSVPVSSITTPTEGKRLYVDPRMLPLLAGRRVVLVDDVISSGTSMLAGLALLEKCGLRPVALGCAMLQSDRWREALGRGGNMVRDRCIGVLASPLLQRDDMGSWRAV
jgi:adenine/guanine phosphoribosyltransferase-like PRPP-binding protein